jgi:hypothetical protein
MNNHLSEVLAHIDAEVKRLEALIPKWDAITSTAAVIGVGHTLSSLLNAYLRNPKQTLSDWFFHQLHEFNKCASTDLDFKKS